MTSGETRVSRREKRKKERTGRGGGRRREEPRVMAMDKEASETAAPRRSIGGELKVFGGSKYRFPIAATKETNPTEREKDMSKDTRHTPIVAWLTQVQDRI
ncbi:hypothetical protein NDU88_002089 [Pleurodeles waltl]|uniref:Uncharacterized protein n=1 Tax=Pleurodeles waltl TaxID=8319 RepID=A0AAV7TM98_PLEWA|nr:hypothetical protein NDU88_002089 [Pleurodeles waltl]